MIFVVPHGHSQMDKNRIRSGFFHAAGLNRGFEIQPVDFNCPSIPFQLSDLWSQGLHLRSRVIRIRKG
jgi:hypothetical protein